MGLLDDLFPKPKNIASDILRRDVRPGGVEERSPVSSHHGDAVLQGSSHAEDVFLDTQPTLAQESLGRASRDRTVHVDNFAGLALDGTDGTGIAQPAGGAGIRGWLSGIYKAITGTLAVSAAALPLPAGASTLAGQVAANFPQVVDMGDAGAHVAAAFFGASQSPPKGARSFIVRLQTAASTATWQPILNVSYDGVNWIRASGVPTSATASSVEAVLSVSVPAMAIAAFQTTGATLQIIANLALGMPLFWRIEYANSGATGFTINIAKVLYD